jgi:hypothetical protein
MIALYDPKNWYWQVGEDTSRFWSSAAAAYVSEAPAERTTRIANEVELYDALVRVGLKKRAPVRSFSVAEIRAALLRIDVAATGDANDAASLAAVAEDLSLSLPAMAP